MTFKTASQLEATIIWYTGVIESAWVLQDASETGRGQSVDPDVKVCAKTDPPLSLSP
ncbi:hypothetical protein [Candidatus Sororendozoicomonas aggregata]|uniref:hypothetical protein n=1 Tax=Candidatus Sororendozoicomonas aggregata TaxID=3073239 RepID=UPI002ED28CEB